MLRPKPKVFTKTKTPNHTCLRRLHKKLLTVISLMTLAAVLSASVPAQNNQASSATTAPIYSAILADNNGIFISAFYDFYNYLTGNKPVQKQDGASSQLVPQSSIDFEPTTYIPGSINGQDGWICTGCDSSTTGIDHAVVANSSSAPASFGAQSLRLSNAVNGNLDNQSFSKPLIDEAGETAAVNENPNVSRTRFRHFETQFDIASALPGQEQSGLNMTVSPTRGDEERMSYLLFEDTPSGINVTFNDYQDMAPLGGGTADSNGCGVEDDFVPALVATGLNRLQPHTIRLVMDFVDGPHNDIVKVFVDGILVKTGTSWEDYYRYCPEQAGIQNKVPTVDSLYFYSRDDKPGPAVPENVGNGFLFDNLSLAAANGETLYALSNNVIDPMNTNPQPLQSLVSFDSFTPGVASAVVPITGLQTGEKLVGIDFRPSNNALYGLGSGSRLYAINTATGVATQVGSDGAFTLSGQTFGFDFNPTVDRIRVISNTGQNIRLNPITGGLAGTDTMLNQNGITGAAYTNNTSTATVTTLYDINSTNNTLVLQGGINSSPSPNGGVITSVGPLGVTVTDVNGFDISGSSQTAYAALNNSLYTVNLTSGMATSIGMICTSGCNFSSLEGLTTAPAVINNNDVAPPRVVSINRSNPTSARTNATALEFAVTFSEPVSGVDLGDFSVSTTGSVTATGNQVCINSSNFSAACTAPVPGTLYDTYYYRLNANPATDESTIRVNVIDDDTIADAAGNKLGGTGNGNGNYMIGQTFTIDRTAPTVAITAGSPVVTDNPSITFNVAFSEAVMGFGDAASDVTLSGGTCSLGTPSFTTIDARNYTVTVLATQPSGTSSSCTVTASVPAGAAQDLAGSNNTASPTPATVTYAIPTVSVVRTDNGSEAPTAPATTGTTPATFTVSLVVPSGLTRTRDVSGTVSFTDGTATGGTCGATNVDYDNTAQTFLFGANDSNSTVVLSVPVCDDLISEVGGETFTGAISSVTNGVVTATTATARTATIADNEGTPAITITPVITAGVNGAEPNTNAQFTITQDPVSSMDTTVYVSTVDGTATAGLDYTGQSLTAVTIPAWMPSATFEVVVLNDTIDEPQENFTVELRTANDSTTAAFTLATGTIADDDNAPAISISDVTTLEGNTGDVTPAQFTLTLSNPSSVPVTVQVATANDTATAGADYSSAISTNIALSGTASQSSTAFSGAASRANDGNTNGVYDPNGNGNYTDDGSVSHTGPSETTGETEPYWQVDLGTVQPINGINVWNRTDCCSDRLSYFYVFVKNTAFTTTTIADTTADPGVTTYFVNQVGTATNPKFVIPVGTGLSGQFVRIQTDSDGGTFGDITYPANPGPRPQDGNIYLNLAEVEVFSPAATQSPTTVTFAPGQTTASVSVNVLGDVIDEADETFFVNLTAPTGATIADDQGVGTITDDDGAPTVQFNPTTYTVAENVTSGTVTLTATRTGAQGNAFSVPFTVEGGTATGGASCTTSGVDYVNTGGTFTFAANDASATATVAICDDVIFEGDETFTATLGTPTGDFAVLGADSTATVTITDDEGQPTLSIELVSGGSETTTPVNDPNTTTPNVFRVTLSGASTQTVSVTYTTGDSSPVSAVADADYSSTTGTITFDPTATDNDADGDGNPLTQTFSVATLDDLIFEGGVNGTPETFVATLSEPSNATIATDGGTATGTITDNEAAPTITLVAVSSNATEGGAAATFQAVSSGASYQDITVSVSAAGSGTNPASASDFTLSPTSVTFPASTTTPAAQTITVSAVDDAIFEPTPETFTVSLGTVTAGTATVGTPSSQAGTITDNDNCSYTVSPASPATFGPAAGNGSFTITVASGCSVTASSNAAFITNVAVSADTGTGSRTVSYTVASNAGTTGPNSNNGAARSGTISFSVNGVSATYLINQGASAVTVDIPDNLQAVNGTTLTVPVNVTSDTTGRGILSFDFLLTYDSMILGPPITVSNTGTMSSGFSVSIAPEGTNQVRVSGFAVADADNDGNSDPLMGSGTLININFQVVGTAFNCGQLTFAEFTFNEGDPAAMTSGGQACVINGAITGRVIYGNNRTMGTQATPNGTDDSATARPVPNTTLTGVPSTTGQPTVTGMSMCPDGMYSLMGFGTGTYTVTPSKVRNNDVNGITSQDASRIQQAVLGSVTLTTRQIQAADVSKNGAVTSFDAALIQQYILNSTTASTNPQNNTGRWEFDPTSRVYTNTTANMTNQDYAAILLGDVTGNWASPCIQATIVAEDGFRNDGNNVTADGSKASASNIVAAGIPVTLPNSTTSAGMSFDVAINVGDLTGQNVTSYDFDILYDQNVVQPQTTQTDKNGTISSGLTVGSTIVEPGKLRVSAFGPTPVSGSGILLKLKFQAVGANGTMSDLSFAPFMFNEGLPSNMTNIGQVRVLAPTAATATVSGRVTTASRRSIAGATVTLTDSNGVSRSVAANLKGFYQFGGVRTGETYVISVSGKNFTGTEQVITVLDNLTDVNLTF